MDEALRARFLPRFIETAKGRLATLGNLLAARDEPGAAVAVRSEFHSLAGEASMLGLVEVGEAARHAENAAVAWQEGDKSASLKCVRALRPLNRAVAALQVDSSGPEADGEPSSPASESTVFVLVVDDSAINADAVVDGLEEAGISAASASNREEMLTSLGERLPSLVLADVYMPDVTLEEVVSMARQAEVPKVLLLSGLSQEELQGIAARVGADGAVSKAGGIAQVVAAVKTEVGA